MQRFLDDAQRIFDAAQAVSSAGQAVTELTVLIGPEGGIHLVADSDWPLERLRAERGAWSAYRVAERHGKVSVEGSRGHQVCRLESESPRQVARRLLNATPAPLPAGTPRLLPEA
ncbi:MAG: hypothetical protein FJW34_13725 [Acidobacteria bacterium]|nr:hypothetical protein [Acidobacteriota bacterium]